MPGSYIFWGGVGGIGGYLGYYLGGIIPKSRKLPYIITLICPIHAEAAIGLAPTGGERLLMAL